MTFSEDYKNELYNFIVERIESWLDKDYKRQALNTCIEYYFDEIAESYYDAIGNDMGAAYVCNGVSKLVMGFDEYPDVVFKFPFLSISHLDDISVKYDEYLYSSDLDFYDYERFNSHMYGANNGFVNCLSDDYCDCEQKIYARAVDADVEDMFAETSFLGISPSDVKVYVSSRCKSAHFISDNAFKITANNSLKNHDYYFDMSATIGGVFIEDYGADEFNKLLDFLESVHIGDIHSGNVMENAYGNITIVDYSDYNGE